jgi:UDP-N-acetylmuramoyl-L-alanyl-D-glutamate--2,6-diaminopimelate ligase
VAGGEKFVCLDGLARNGHDFAATAVSQGAVALVVDHPLPVAGAAQVVVPDTREAAARLAAAFHGHPSRRLSVIGVTGTNGKTTVTHLLRGIAEAAGIPAAVLGTLGGLTGGGYHATGYTTPEAPELQAFLRDAALEGRRWVAMEVSSHALVQKRAFATTFAAVVFTNLSRDHLDYHGTMEAYFEAKALLFSRSGRGSGKDAVAVVNLEDPLGRTLAARTTDRVAGYGFGPEASYRALDVETGPGGTRYVLQAPGGRVEVRLALVGRYNVLNALAAQATALELGVRLPAAARGAAAVARVPGRLEPVEGSQPFLVLVDYAHTPDALERTLEAVRGIARGRLHLVFGCGGDRDRGKRPEMGRVAAAMADRVIVTSDNPRSEDPETILDEILAGVGGATHVERLADREAAIRAAVRGAAPGDVVLLAGKGHEREQITGRDRRPFDDRSVAAAALRDMGFDVDDLEPAF